MALAMLAKPQLWWPGRNPKAASLWRSCLGLWAFNEGSGSFCNDLSSAQAHGRLLNASPPQWVGTPYGCGLQLDRTDDFIQCGTLDTYDNALSAGFSYLIVAKSQSTGSFDRLVAIENADESNYGPSGQWNILNNRLEVGSGGADYAYADCGIVSSTNYVAIFRTNYTLAGSWFYVNRVKYLPQGAGYPRYVSSVGRLDIGRFRSSSASYYSGATFSLVALFGCGLSDEDCVLLSADPFLMIRPDVARVSYFFPSGHVPHFLLLRGAA